MDLSRKLFCNLVLFGTTAKVDCRLPLRLQRDKFSVSLVSLNVPHVIKICHALMISYPKISFIASSTFSKRCDARSKPNVRLQFLVTPHKNTSGKRKHLTVMQQVKIEFFLLSEWLSVWPSKTHLALNSSPQGKVERLKEKCLHINFDTDFLHLLNNGR